MIDMKELQRTVATWQRRTFPDATAESAAKHLAEEVAELTVALAEGVEEEIAKELGDVVLLTMAVASLKGIDLEIATVFKFMIAKRREYRYDPQRGYAVHVKDELAE